MTFFIKTLKTFAMCNGEEKRYETDPLLTMYYGP